MIIDRLAVQGPAAISGRRRPLSRLLLWLLMFMAPLAATAATSAFVMSVSPGKAQVIINGSAVRTLLQGQTTPESGPGQLPHALIGMSFLQGIELRNVGRRMELIQKQF